MSLSIRDQSQVRGFSAWSELNYFVYRKLSSWDAFFKWYHNRTKWNIFTVLVACVASVSVRFRSKERGTRVKDRAKNGEKVKERGGGGSCFTSRAAKTENPVPRSFFAPKPNGNACYASYCFCSRSKHDKQRLRVVSYFFTARDLRQKMISFVWIHKTFYLTNLIKHRDTSVMVTIKEQNTGQPEERIMKVKENYKQLSKRSTDSFYQSFSSLFANHLKLHSRRYMFLRKRRSFEYRHCRCLARIAIALNLDESLLGVWTNPVYKTSWASLLAKQAVTVGFSSGFNVKLLHEWSNFDLPKLMPVEHIFFMPSSCLSLTLIHAKQRRSQGSLLAALRVWKITFFGLR